MQPISQTAQIANVMQQTAAAAERVFEFLEEEEIVEDVENSISTKIYKVLYNLKMLNLDTMKIK